ncbi:MAG: queuosine precursor transporter [Mycobacteriaceae bacterium]|nr:queuosine precursor transporter [Mycobacteriaceae bacterium]
MFTFALSGPAFAFESGRLTLALSGPAIALAPGTLTLASPGAQPTSGHPGGGGSAYASGAAITAVTAAPAANIVVTASLLIIIRAGLPLGATSKHVLSGCEQANNRPDASSKDLPTRGGQPTVTADATTNDQPAAGVASVGSAYYPVLVGVFTGLVLISNILATKAVAFGPIVGHVSIITDGAFILFPLSYVVGDVLSEVYGFRATRRAIYTGLTMQSIAVIAYWVTIFMPAATFYTNQESFKAVVGASTLIIIGSLAGFACGQTLNAWVVVAIKARTKERHLWARLIGSTVVGELADTLVFCTFAAWAIGINTMRDFLIYVVWGWFYKSAVETVVMPVTYRVIAYVKRREPTYRPAE